MPFSDQINLKTLSEDDQGSVLGTKYFLPSLSRSCPGPLLMLGKETRAFCRQAPCLCRVTPLSPSLIFKDLIIFSYVYRCELGGTRISRGYTHILVRVTVAVMKLHDQKQVGEEMIYLVYASTS